MLSTNISLYKLLPEKYKQLIERNARYARISGYEIFVEISVLASIISSLIIAPLPFLSLKLRIIILASDIPLGFFVPYAYIMLAADKRREEIERILPDALLLISANIKSGLTVDKALLLSARNEFGPLAKELRITAMQMFGGKSLEQALNNLKGRSNSEIFDEVIKLLIDGVKSGGNLSDLLESSARDIRKTLNLRKEIISNVRMYVVFILMAALFGSPLLFAISNYLTSTTAQLWGSTNVEFSELPTSTMFEIQQPEFRPAFFHDFSLAAIVITNLFAALIISEIKNGNAKQGIKYVPIFIIISLFIFFVVNHIVSTMVGGLAWLLSLIVNEKAYLWSVARLRVKPTSMRNLFIESLRKTRW